MNKLFIDTSTKASIIMIEQDGVILASQFDLTENDHSERLMPAIEALFQQTGLSINDIDEFYVSEGPGSYTGIRIGVTVAKMFAYTLKKPIYSISSLSIIASPYLQKAKYIIPIIDARRQNVFTTIYEVTEADYIPLIDEQLLSIDLLVQIIKEKNLTNCLFVGLDTDNFSSKFDEENIRFTANLQEDFNPEVIFSNLNFKKVDDIHQFSPNYNRKTEAERNLNHDRL